MSYLYISPFYFHTLFMLYKTFLDKRVLDLKFSNHTFNKISEINLHLYSTGKRKQNLGIYGIREKICL